MSEATLHAETVPRAPWHLGVVGVLSLLWNAAGTYTIIAAERGTLADLEPGEAAYYAAQATWFVIVTHIALYGSIAAALAVLLRSRFAVPLYAISLAAIVVTNGYDLAMGTSNMFNNTATVVVTLAIWVLAVLQLWYAVATHRRGLLT